MNKILIFSINLALVFTLNLCKNNEKANTNRAMTKILSHTSMIIPNLIKLHNIKKLNSWRAPSDQSKSKNKQMKDNNCLTQTNFQNVWKEVMMNPSKTTLTIDEIKWEISFYMDEDIKILLFRIDGWTVGIIDSDLKVLSTAKVHKENEKMKVEIKNVFCKLVEL
jgi:hypothetical protein